MIKVHRKAFSLIELSIVVLIIGILIAGVTQSSRLLRESKIKTAQAITRSSSISLIPNLMLWLEPTMDDSITSNTNGNVPEDGDAISAWNDYNPRSLDNLNVSQSTLARMPTYQVDGINGIPSLSFDGTADYLNSSTAPIEAGDDDYTYVIVWNYDSDASSAIRILLHQGTNTASNITGGVYLTASNTYGFIGSNNNYSPTSISKGRSYISIIRVDNSSAVNVSIYTNGSLSSGITNGSGPGALNLDNTDFSIARHANTNANFFDGLISEVMVFDRALKTSEINDINSYLGKKYSVTIP